MNNSFILNLVKGSILNSPTRLESLARKTGWMIRKPKKLKPVQFIHGMLHGVSQGDCSFRLLASAIGMRLDENANPDTSFDTISKPALWERVTPEAVAFIKATLAELLKGEKTTEQYSIPAIPSVNRIIVEDSAILNLNQRLTDEFPAYKNQHGCGAGLRFQLAVDLISGEPIRVDLTKYSRNDQSASGDIIPLLKENDLLIRDLGYCVMASLNAIVEKGANFVSRHFGTRVLHHSKENGGERIILLKHLQKYAPEPGDQVDLDVTIGSGEKGYPCITCRLVARRVPQQVEEKRLRKIHQDEKKLGKEFSQAHKKLQGWEVYITSLSREEVSAETIMELYPLRWRIEVIFKACKSYTPIKAIAAHQSNANHVQSLIYAWLCLLVMATQTKAFALARGQKSSPGKLKPNCLSLLKVMPKVFQILNMALLFSSAPIHQIMGRWLRQMEYHDRYERRKNRINMAEMLTNALALESPGIGAGKAPETAKLMKHALLP